MNDLTLDPDDGRDRPPGVRPRPPARLVAAMATGTDACPPVELNREVNRAFLQAREQIDKYLAELLGAGVLPGELTLTPTSTVTDDTMQIGLTATYRPRPAAGIVVSVPVSPDGAEILASIREHLKPTHTALVKPERAAAVRQSVERLPGGCRIRVVESPYLPDDQIYLIDHEALGMDPMADLPTEETE
jgi:hypothetical protein